MISKPQNRFGPGYNNFDGTLNKSDPADFDSYLLRNTQEELKKSQFQLPKLSKHMFRNPTDDFGAKEVGATNLSDSDEEVKLPKTKKLGHNTNGKTNHLLNGNGQINSPNGKSRLNRQKSTDFRRVKSDSNPERRLNKLKSMDFRKEKAKKSPANSPEASEVVKEAEDTDNNDSIITVEEEISEVEKEKRRVRNKKRKERRARSKNEKSLEITEGEETVTIVGESSPLSTRLSAISDIPEVSDVDSDIEDTSIKPDDVTLDSIFNDDDTADSESLMAPPALSRLTKLRTSSSKSLKFDTMNVLVSTYESESPSTDFEKSELRNMSIDRRVSIEESIRLNKKKSMEFTSSQLSQDANPFDLIKLRLTKKSTTNSKYSEKLPELLPIKTIIGLSHKQILNLDKADVKLKTIFTSSKISKYALSGMTFTTNHTEELFEDEHKKRIFVILCINVALYESIGFKKTVKVYPNVLELFGGYSEINLETTKTKLTPSNKDIHQNNLDYSVLSYIGHILIWAAHQQRQNRVELLTKDYEDFPMTASLIRENVGGYHLWDRLIREPTGMNSKRWKHIIKFRQAFPYEEDQFMLILRYMKVDSNIP